MFKWCVAVFFKQQSLDSEECQGLLQCSAEAYTDLLLQVPKLTSLKDKLLNSLPDLVAQAIYLTLVFCMREDFLAKDNEVFRNSLFQATYENINGETDEPRGGRSRTHLRMPGLLPRRSSVAHWETTAALLASDRRIRSLGIVPPKLKQPRLGSSQSHTGARRLGHSLLKEGAGIGWLKGC